MNSGLGESALDFVVARAADPATFERWTRQGRSARWCSQPVRLVGGTTTIDAATGELFTAYRTDAEPDGVLVKACGQRRATACPQCAEVYRVDAWHLIAAGLRGGKGIEATVASHPMVFATFTAPSFGAVHSQRQRNGRVRICRAAKGVCPHGQPHRCTAVHGTDDPRIGQPLCPDCFDYRAAVLWNAHVPELWRRTVIGLQRALARTCGQSRAALARSVRPSFVKVVEYQRRGVVHLHAVIRLDGPDAPSSRPGIDISTAVLEVAVRQAAAGAHAPYPGAGARWGSELDVRPIHGAAARPEAVAAYIAKYATKSTDAIGRLDRRLTADDFDTLDLPPHLHRLVATAWDLGGDPALAHLGLRRWAHTLGFRGHWLTKSRRYSTTFGALRDARARWASRQHDQVPDADDAAVVKNWRYVGRGWANPGDAWLAETAAAELAEARRHARDARQGDLDTN